MIPDTKKINRDNPRFSVRDASWSFCKVSKTTLLCAAMPWVFHAQSVRYGLLCDLHPPPGKDDDWF